MQRASDLPADMRERTWLEPALVIRDADGRVNRAAVNRRSVPALKRVPPASAAAISAICIV